MDSAGKKAIPHARGCRPFMTKDFEDSPIGSTQFNAVLRRRLPCPKSCCDSRVSHHAHAEHPLHWSAGVVSIMFV
jgi:hypothetical protein